MNVVYRKPDGCCTHSVHSIEADTFSDAYSLQSIAGCFESDLYAKSLIAVVDNEVAAYIIATDVAGEAEIQRIAVVRSMRHCGIGSALLSEFAQNCRQSGIGCIHLEVRESNIAAISLYRKSGFCQVGVRKAYYTDTGEDAILYTLKLQ